MRLDAASRSAALSPLDVGRLTDAERAALYTRVMGAPGGSADESQPNREFNDLWLRFVSAVSSFGRQQGTDRMLRASQALAAVSGEFVRHAARDLAQVIDRPATLELRGGAVNSARHRALAEAGGAILESLASGRANDASLIHHGERWLALSTVSDDDVERLSQPEAARAHIDAWSRSLFDAVGLPPLGTDRPTDAPLRATAVFAGPTGTGKTLAAHLLGAAAGVDVHRVDLGAVVSKYIGETEKNLDRVFGAARNAGALLLFDEADALMGKRSDVKDAHDRYANVEVGYLAARLADFDGVAIMATQQSADTIDPRLLERVDARVVRFPLPPR